MDQRINIRPGVSILSVLRHLRYSYWHALAEFVDNALQSFLANRERLTKIDGEPRPLQVDIVLQPTDGGVITVRDNAAGIARSEFPRAFRPAELPLDRTGFAEFGMGMKSAACWCAHGWSVRTKPIDSKSEYIVRFDIDSIVSAGIEELEVLESPADERAHYTEIRLEGLHKTPTGRTLGKIKEHLADIYRDFCRRGELVLTFDGEVLKYEEPKILVAPYFKEEGGAPREWRLPIDFDFGGGMRAHGFAAIRERASTTRAGFALFRRGRVIQGSGDEGYRPEKIFGKSNSFMYQRIFGELHLEGFEVTHTKDGFKWDDNEDVFLDLLKEELSKDAMPLLQQARGYRVGERTEDLRAGAEEAGNHVADALQRNAAPVVADLRGDQSASPVPAQLPPANALVRREIELQLAPWTWIVTIEQTADPAAEWLELGDGPSRPDRNRVRRLGLRLSLAHPFMQRFAGSDPDLIEPILRIAAAIGLAETIARESAEPNAFGRIRQNVNELLRRALAAP
jgi:hypothetical protein